MIKMGGRQSYDIDGLIKEIEQPRIKVVLCFFSVEYERFEPHRALKRAFPQAVCVVGSMLGGWCTTGVVKKGVVALSLSTDEVEEVFSTLKEGVKTDAAKTAAEAVEDLKRKIGYRSLDPDNYLGIVLSDGLSLGEEIVQVLSLDGGLNLPFVGGAAADELNFTKTLVGLDNQVSADGLVLLVMKMKIPFHYNHYVHFTPTTTSMVVTKSEAKHRIIWELNGEPAAPYYAKLVGLKSIDQITSDVFALNPVGVVSGNMVYCRSLHKVIEGGGLVCYCYIEAGTTLHLLKRGDIIADARRTLQDGSAYLPQVQGAILFNCAHRLMELQTLNKVEAFNDAFRSIPFIGLNVYGEDLFIRHNQTLTAVFFGRY